MFLVVVLPLLFLFIVVPVLTLLYGISRWQSQASELLRRLEASRGQSATRTFNPDETRDLPGPVQRYFQAVLTPGHPVVAVAELSQEGEIRTDLEQAGWRRFTADQVTSTERPGFHWDARIR